jgi:GDP/UDP-N,N'-diacetylbacillosamine 2-epimerase (hydrolysing)
MKIDSFFEVQIVVGGAHLKAEYGLTKQEIIDDGYDIDYEIDYLPNDTNGTELAKASGFLLESLAKVVAQARPDAFLILGDRYELIPVAYTALLTNTLLLHISGGEVTEGAMDNQVRHALTKMAHLHFPSNEQSKKNILAMGEEDWRICVSGEPGLDYIKVMNKFDRLSICQQLKLDPNFRIFLCTFHPETLSLNLMPAQIIDLFKKILIQFPDAQILATAANSDPSGAEINDALRKIVGKLDRYSFISSLGQKRYYSLLEHTALMIGNTSSGIVEAQSFYVPAINVGHRQQGRDQNINTINVEMDSEKIISAIESALSSNFKTRIQVATNIYGDGNSSVRIIEFLKKNSQKSKAELLLKKSVF